MEFFMKGKNHRAFENTSVVAKPMRSGVSMIEVLFALVILASIFAGLFQVLHTGFQGTERLSEESYAANHAISLLESITALDYSKIPLIPAGTADTELAGYFSSVNSFYLATAADPDFPRTVEIALVSEKTDNPLDGNNSEWGALKSIKVTITWRAAYLKGDVRKTRVFHTLVTNDMEVTR